MQIKRIKTLLPSMGGEAQIQAMSWSPNNQKFAVCTADRVIHLFDEFGDKKDKFSTKPCDAKFGKTSYLVNALAFSHDATMLAVAQSDNIVFVYKIGADWGDKKSIVAKLIQNSPITCMLWMPDGQIVFGLADGKIRSGNVKKNKSTNLYTAENYTVSLVTNSSGKAIISGHSDGSLVRFIVSEENNGETQGVICRHSTPPYALAWTPFGIVVGGCDKRIVVYTKEGRLLQQFDYSKDLNEKDFTVAESNPTGQMVVVGSYNRLRIFNWSPRKGLFEESDPKEFTNLYTITSIAWKRDGSRLAIGNLTGVVDLYDCSLKKQLYKGKFEMTYVGPSQVIIRNKTTNQKVDLKSHYGYEVFDVKVLGKDRFVMAHTTDTLLIGDLSTGNLSEIPWKLAPGSEEKFYFENENVCMIFASGELTLVEYGSNDVLCSVRTEFMNPHLISVRLNERKQKGVKSNKKMAYLIDLKTISILDLETDKTVAQIQHDLKINWLELNETSKYLLFRDFKMKLHLYNVDTRERNCILNFCSFVQWVPDSDVVVAQNRNNLCIWYNIEAYEKVTMVSIKGDINEVKKENNKTSVVINEGINMANYELDSGLIEFGTAMEDGDLVRAVDYLESVPISEETETMWKTLAKFALEMQQYFIAERCYAALGDVAKARFLRETNRIASENGRLGDGKDFYMVRARIAELEKNFKLAESIFLESQAINEAIEMYQSMYKWEEAIDVAEAKNHPNLEKLKKIYQQWLNDTEQHEIAALAKEREGDYNSAINLYLKSNIPIRASKLLMNHRELIHNQELVNRIAAALIKSDLYENAGELFEKIKEDHKALECYKAGKSFRKAVDLARHCAPQEVVRLEADWGDYLVSQKLYDSAINHYVEAGENLKAVDAAINSRQWKKAVDILATQDSNSAIVYYKRIADHFASNQEFDVAEKFYIQSNHPKECIQMYNKAGKWDRAFKIAANYLTKQEVTDLYLDQARLLEQQGRYKEAEKLYITINDANQAIQMYKRINNYDNMIRLIKEYHPEMVTDTYLHLAREFESMKNYKQAELYFIQANDWKSAVNMYRKIDNWEDAYKVAKNHGGPVASKQVAYVWAKTLGGDSAVKLLNKLGLLDQSIDFALENYAFDFAFDLAKTSSKDKLPEIHARYAMFLEDEGRFPEAEKEFIEAKKPKEAVLMYVHNRDWDNAQRVAEQYDPSLTTDILIGQAKLAFDEKNYKKAESFLLRAQRSDLAVKLYKDNGMWEDALRVCKEYLPNKYDQLKDEYKRNAMTGGTTINDNYETEGLLEMAVNWEKAGEYSKAVDAYTKITPSSNIDKEKTVKCWLRAYDLSEKFLSETKARSVAQFIGPRLVQLKKANQAAEIYLKADMVRECIDAFISVEDWNKAKKVAQQFDASMVAYVEESYRNSVNTRGDLTEMAGYDPVKALEIYADKEEWEEGLKLAEKQNENVLQNFVAKYAAFLIQNAKSEMSLDLYKKYGAPAIKQNFNIYKKLFYDTMKLDSFNTREYYNEWTKLRDILLSLNQNLAKSAERESAEHNYFKKLLLVTHYNTMRISCIGNEQLDTIAAKLSISLLRHTDIIPADKAFYEAGMMCQRVNWDNMAFVFLNRYIDLADAIDEGTNEIIDSPFLAETDIPFEINLPETKYLTNEKHEEIKTWVITISMNRKVEPSLNTDERGIYEASLSSPDGDKKLTPCVITGYPVLEKKLEFKNDLATNVEDWNKFLMAARMSKTDELNDCVQYLGKWCGVAPNPSYNFNN